MIVYARYDARLKDPLTGKERKVKYKSLQYVEVGSKCLESHFVCLQQLLRTGNIFRLGNDCYYDAVLLIHDVRNPILSRDGKRQPPDCRLWFRYFYEHGTSFKNISRRPVLHPKSLHKRRRSRLRRIHLHRKYHIHVHAGTDSRPPGQPGLPLLDAHESPAKFWRPAPDDSKMPQTSPHLHPRSAHAKSRLRAVQRLQRNPAGIDPPDPADVCFRQLRRSTLRWKVGALQ